MSKRVINYTQDATMITTLEPNTENPFDIDDLRCHILKFVDGARRLYPLSLQLRLVSIRVRDTMDRHVLTIYDTKSLGTSVALLGRLSGLRHLSFSMGWAEHTNHKNTLSTLLVLHQASVTSLWIDGRMDLCYRLQHFTSLRYLRLTHCACDQYQASSFNNDGLRSLSNLTCLSLTRTPVSAEALENKPLLHTLRMHGCRNITLPNRFTQLRTLGIDHIDNVFNPDQMSHLTQLTVGHPGNGGYIDNTDMVNICAMTQLQSLSINLPSQSLSSSFLKLMARYLTQLTDLTLMGKQTINVQELVPFVNLRSLGLKKLRPLTRDIGKRRTELALPDGRIIQLYGY